MSRSVCWRAGRSRAPPVSSGSRRSSRPTIACGVSSRTRAAASSIASGRPSSRCADLGDRPGRSRWSARSRAGSRPPARRRARPPRTATARRAPRPGGRLAAPAAAPAYSCSPRSRSGSRLVTSISEAGARRQQLGDDRRGRHDLLEVVQHQQQLTGRAGTPCSVDAPSVSPTSRMPSACAIVGGTRAGSVIGASSTRKTPSLEVSISSAATWRPRRVLPVPPGRSGSPGGRRPRSSRADLGQLALATEQRRRLDRQVVRARVERGRAAGTRLGRSGAVSWETRSGWVRSLSRCSPRSSRPTPLGSSVADEAGGRLGEQDLAAVPGAQQAGHPVQRRPVVVAVPLLGRTGVERHPHARAGRSLPTARPGGGAGRPGRLRPRRGRRANTAWNPSPVVLTTWPPCSTIAARISAS